MEKARSLYRLFSESKGLLPVGIDVHVGSQLLEMEPFEEAFERAAEIVRQLRDDGIDIRTIDVGGGLGVAYREMDEPPSAEDYMALVGKILGGLECEIVFEPGRFLAAQSAVLVSRVVRVKQTETKRFLVLDAGMNDLIRPAIYEAYHGIAAVKEGRNDHSYDVVARFAKAATFSAKTDCCPR